ncbi:MAG: SseB family protein, partial [Oscillospiraceae bacterium]|nr:SseB family protein [Oscillospiraceae bacterium]
MNLEELLQLAMTDISKRGIFLQTLIRSDIFVICRNPVQLENNNSQVQLELITVQNQDGYVFIPFFTSHKVLSM